MAELPFELSPEQAAELVASGDAELIDVREAYEREAGHIPGSRHVELSRLTDHAEELPAERPLVFQCRVGARSAMAAFASATSGAERGSLEKSL